MYVCYKCFVTSIYIYGLVSNFTIIITIVMSIIALTKF